MSDTSQYPVSVDCSNDGDCVDVWLDQITDAVVEIFIQGPPGPVGSGVKSGIVDGASFSGSPKIYAVIFDVPYTDSNYTISISGSDARLFTFQSKTQNGFTINANAGAVLTGQVNWFATAVGA